MIYSKIAKIPTLMSGMKRYQMTFRRRLGTDQRINPPAGGPRAQAHRVVYKEWFQARIEVGKRERSLKTASGGRFLKRIFTKYSAAV